jgi:hypothetical protein
MPLIKQKAQLNDNLSLSFYYANNGVALYPNCRGGSDCINDEYLSAFPKHCYIALGVYGFVKLKEQKHEWRIWISKLIEKLEPIGFIVVGHLPQNIIDEYKDVVEFHLFDSFMEERYKGVRQNATKGPSYRYGNTRGAKHRGKASQHINYAWAKDFNKSRLEKHFIDHGKDFSSCSKQDYAAKAVHFANEIDRKRYKSVIDYHGTTYKYDSQSGAYAAITKDGYVVTYYKPRKGGFTYYPKKGKPVWIKI